MTSSIGSVNEDFRADRKNWKNIGRSDRVWYGMIKKARQNNPYWFKPCQQSTLTWSFPVFLWSAALLQRQHQAQSPQTPAPSRSAARRPSRFPWRRDLVWVSWHWNNRARGSPHGLLPVYSLCPVENSERFFFFFGVVFWIIIITRVISMQRKPASPRKRNDNP